ncbi:MAG: hypothetical protein HY551_03265 [Elusimicrobia bacterium]|nr:hypothetical protein [Elusimicrobiota bacterium]
MRRSNLLLPGAILLVSFGHADPRAEPPAPAARAAQRAIVLSPDDPPYDHTKTPLADDDFLLLSKNGYRFQADGTIRPPGTTRPVGRSEMPLLIEELTGKQRLKAMLELDVLFNRHGTKNLPADALTEVRRIARQNWPVLPQRLRSDLKSYFSLREIEAMDTGVKPIRAPHTWLPLEAPAPYAAADSTLPAPAAGAEPPAAASAAPAFKVSEPSAPPRLEPVGTPVAPPPQDSAPEETPAAQPPAPPTATPPQTLVEAELALPAQALSESFPEISSDEFEKHLAQSDHSPEMRLLLKMISDHASRPVRRLALGALDKHRPALSIDAQRAAARAYAWTEELSGPPQHTRIALQTGSVLWSQSRFLFGISQMLLPATENYYRGLGMPAPKLEALNPSAAGQAEAADDGKTARFSDGSRRLQYTPEQSAGALLHELVTLALTKAGSGADAYRNELFARSCEFQFYDNLSKDTGKPPLLDRQKHVQYAEWRDRPMDAWDFTLQSLTAPLPATALPHLSGGPDSRKNWALRHDLSLLKGAGLPETPDVPQNVRTSDFSADPEPSLEEAVRRELREAAQPSAAEREWLSQENGIREKMNEPR